MTGLRFVNGTIVGRDDPAGLLVVAGRIGQWDAASAATEVDLDGGFLLPGFIDTQVNGGGGVRFNDMPTMEPIAAIGAAHRGFGSTAFLPTMISDDLGRVDAAMRAIEQAIDAGAPGVIGDPSIGSDVAWK